jgi:archaemetzincin
VLEHETGHMVGLAHCIYFNCLMNGSNHLAESDRRPLHLCPVCLRKLQWSIGFDVVARYGAPERVTCRWFHR